MKKIAYLALAVVIAAGLAAVFPVLAQTTGTLTCDIVPGTRVIGYLGGLGSDSYLASKNNVENSLTLAAIRLRGQGGNFVASTLYDVTANFRVTAAAADLNMDGLADLVLGGRGCDSNGMSDDTNLSLQLSLGLDPLDPTRFKFKDAGSVNYLPT